MHTAQLLAWTDLEARRRLGWARVWGRRVAVAAALAALVGWRQADQGSAAALATWHSVIVGVFATTMLASALGMFWRHDAGMLARLPIGGAVLLRAAVMRAARAAVIAALTAVVAAAPIAAAAAAGGAIDVDVWPVLARGGAIIATLAIAAAALTPAAAAAAALLVSGGSMSAATRSMIAVAQGAPKRAAAELASGQGAPSTTALGALPGTAAAWMVILAITVRWWMLGGGTTAIGPALPWLGAAVVVSLLALAAVWKKGEGMAVALREVAALDRQRLAHLEIHPPRGLERVVMAAVGPRAGLVYSRAARLMRRRYPMAFAIGFSAWVVAIGIAVWKPDDAVVWTIGMAATLAAYALALASRLSRPPIDMPRLTAQLPVPAATSARARVGWILGWTLVFAVPPVVIAAVAAHTGVIPILVVGAGTVIASVIAAARTV